MRADPAADDFLYLALTLIHQLPSSSSVAPDEAVLLRLQSLFGSMLMSALQLLDRREVMHFTLPTGRKIWQVGSSSGAPYTIHLSLPPTPRPASTSSAQKDAKQPPTASDENGIDQPAENDAETNEAEVKEKADESALSLEQHVSLVAQSLRGVYCPCTGFAYNSLTSERNVFCKHLLAILLAERMERAYETDVMMHNVANLLDVARRDSGRYDGRVKVEAAGVKMEEEEWEG